MFYKKDCLVNQLIDLFTNLSQQQQLIQYLGIPLSKDKSSREWLAYQSATKAFINDGSILIWGILIRETQPHEKDLQKGFDQLAEKVPQNYYLFLNALYSELPFKEWKQYCTKKAES